jgi:hypothetical protein
MVRMTRWRPHEGAEWHDPEPMDPAEESLFDRFAAVWKASQSRGVTPTHWRIGVGIRGVNGEEIVEVQRRPAEYDLTLPETAIIAEPNELSRLESMA